MRLMPRGVILYAQRCCNTSGNSPREVNHPPLYHQRFSVVIVASVCYPSDRPQPHAQRTVQPWIVCVLSNFDSILTEQPYEYAHSKFSHVVTLSWHLWKKKTRWRDGVPGISIVLVL